MDKEMPPINDPQSLRDEPSPANKQSLANEQSLSMLFEAVAPPEPLMPVQELTKRYTEACQEARRQMQGMPANMPSHGPDFLIEMRLRAWAERQMQEFRSKEAPVYPRNKIPPPPRKP